MPESLWQIFWLNCNLLNVISSIASGIIQEIAKKKKSFLSAEKLDRNVIGFDINHKRIEELKTGYDRTNEISQSHDLSNIFFDLTNDFKKLTLADIFIISVPTPIDNNNKPDLTAIKNASITVAKALKLKKASQTPGKEFIASISKNDIKKIAETKMQDLNTDNAESAERMVAGTARSMGIKVE